ncbi:hypothetical protein QO034_09750 [Sedimentitalea sp. JM2-8]|uniref:Sulfotransferase family protein n=1 Tax=Sedimentitalea xiamensis TaxID=3050037 RepID=A0ABT7FE52_9RHOB|nr:hypothetical protein [Sedimentitalea xiamensis]MDK3073393.1 hypothetical protein [Sedimentitalea xiamensis]
MSRRLVLHLGVQKTGSTSLHRFLGENADRLAGRLAVLTPVKGSPMRALGRAATRFSLLPTPENRAALAGAARQVRECLPAGETPVLISHENLCGAMPGNGGVVTLYPRIEPILAVLEEVFAPMRPEIVIYSRDMADWKRSVYGQAVRSDAYSGTRAQFLDQTADCGTWNDLEDRLVAHLGADRCRVFRLEDEADETRPGGQLLRHAGLSDAEIAALTPITGRRNPSLNAGALEFLRQINGLNLDRRARRAVADLVGSRQSLFKANVA